MNRLIRFGSNLRTSFWFVPTLIVALSVVLALALIEADYSGSQQWMARWPRLFGANAEGARGMLTTIAGSMMAVVGVTFSTTLVTLALASSQYTSRILRDAAPVRLAHEYKTIVCMERGIGMFVVHDTALVSVALEDPPEKNVIAAVQAAYSIDRHRTLQQDTAFGIRQIVDMALRALSPSVNDTTTAVMCVDYLTAILARLASRNIPPSHCYADGELRVIAIGPTFAGLVAESFDQIRGSAQGNVGIMLRMLGALQTIASLAASPSRRRVLREEVECIGEFAARTIESPQDRARFERRLARVRDALDTEPVLAQSTKA